MFSKQDVAQEMREAQRSGIWVQMKRMISQRLREHYSLAKQQGPDDRSTVGTRKARSTAPSKQPSIADKTANLPIVVETSSKSEVNDESTITEESARTSTMIRTQKRKAQRQAAKKKDYTVKPIVETIEDSTEEKGDLNKYLQRMSLSLPLYKILRRSGLMIVCHQI